MLGKELKKAQPAWRTEETTPLNPTYHLVISPEPAPPPKLGTRPPQPHTSAGLPGSEGRAKGSRAEPSPSLPLPGGGPATAGVDTE